MEHHAREVDANLALVAGWILTIIAAVIIGEWGVTAVAWGLAAGVNTWIGHRIFYAAQKYLPAVAVASVNAANSILTAVGAWFIYSIAIRNAQLPWGAVAICGMALGVHALNRGTRITTP
jgi:drug/metabolite transporter (DMT)-like permease